jgi:hypothetical protein
VKIRYYLLVKKDNSILISLLGSILKINKFHYWNRNDIKFIHLLGAGAENRCSSTKVRANIRYYPLSSYTFGSPDSSALINSPRGI